MGRFAHRNTFRDLAASERRTTPCRPPPVAIARPILVGLARRPSTKLGKISCPPPPSLAKPPRHTPARTRSSSTARESVAEATPVIHTFECWNTPGVQGVVLSRISLFAVPLVA